MREPFFNLVDEPWLKVLMMDGKESTLGLRELFAKSSEIRTLSGETPLQDNAVLRFLIAITVTCFYRYDMGGNESILEDEDEAIERFRDIWNNGCFPRGFVDSYLDKWYDRFYLIGGEYPFYQVPDKYTKEAVVKKDNKNPSGLVYLLSPFNEWDKTSWINPMSFNGVVLQSSNTSSPFANKGGKEKNQMSPEEGARWVLYYMNYADCSSKIPGKWNAGMTFSSSGANIHPLGHNLFETIMMCSALLDGDNQLYPSVTPAWERDGYTEINSSPYGEAMPDNIPELYTQQSRKIIIHYQGEFIDGMYVAAGDRYGTSNAFIEPMFAFHKDASDKTGNTMKPNHLHQNCVGWKEYRNIFMSEFSNPARWVNYLFERDILSLDLNVPYVLNDIAYGSMQCTVDYVVGTRIAVNKKYFTDSLEIEKAANEIDHVNEISGILKRFGQRIDYAYGAKKEGKGQKYVGVGSRLAEEYELLAGKMIESLLLDKEKDMDEFHMREVRLAEEVADQILEEINILGFVGHGDQSIGKAENGFRRDIYEIKKKLSLTKGGENNE